MLSAGDEDIGAGDHVLDAVGAQLQGSGDVVQRPCEFALAEEPEGQALLNCRMSRLQPGGFEEVTFDKVILFGFPRGAPEFELELTLVGRKPNGLGKSRERFAMLSA